MLLSPQRRARMQAQARAEVELEARVEPLLEDLGPAGLRDLAKDLPPAVLEAAERIRVRKAAV